MADDLRAAFASKYPTDLPEWATCLVEHARCLEDLEKAAALKRATYPPMFLGRLTEDQEKQRDEYEKVKADRIEVKRKTEEEAENQFNNVSV